MFKETMCRVCLAECSNSSDDIESFRPAFSRFIKIKYFENGIPKKICKDCADDLLTIEQFYYKFERTQNILKGLLGFQPKQETKPDTNHFEILHISLNSDYIDSNSLELDKFDTNQSDCKLNSSKIVKKNHPKRQQPPLGFFSCDICQHTTFSKDGIRHHIKQKHLNEKNEKKYQCKYCDRSYQNYNSFKSHTTYQHTKDFSYFCAKCNKGFINESRLASHMSKHSTTRGIICDICGDSFKSIDYLRCHKRDVHAERHLKCNFCEKTFKCRKNLRQHEQFHKPHAFKCPKCPDKFSVGQSLRSHLKKNHPELPMAVPGCNLRNLESVEQYLELCKS